MAEIDEIYDWFNENFTFTNNDNDVIIIKELMEYFKSSNKYINKSNSDKRFFSSVKFTKYIESNQFLGPYFKSRHQKNGEDIRSVLVCYKYK